MKRGLILLVLVAFVFAIGGCAPKSEYDKLLDQKKALEKKCETVNAEKEELKRTISSRDMEIKDLKNELKTANAKVKDLEKELGELKAKTVTQ